MSISRFFCKQNFREGTPSSLECKSFCQNRMSQQRTEQVIKVDYVYVGVAGSVNGEVDLEAGWREQTLRMYRSGCCRSKEGTKACFKGSKETMSDLQHGLKISKTSVAIDMTICYENFRCIPSVLSRIQSGSNWNLTSFMEGINFFMKISQSCSFRWAEAKRSAEHKAALPVRVLYGETWNPWGYSTLTRIVFPGT